MKPRLSERHPTFTFIDLFAGIGGFHAALQAMGGRCVYAVEIDPAAAAVYQRNWGIDPLGDITCDANDEHVSVPEHDVLAAGFPCQPFSKSGAQLGMEEARGTLVWNILKIVQVRHPRLVILENVRNLAGPRHTHEWDVIIETLRAEGYRVSTEPAIFSPHLLSPQLGGRPQVRERVFITATWLGRTFPAIDLVAPAPIRNEAVDGWHPSRWDFIRDLPLDPDHTVSGCNLTASERLWIDAWDDFVRLMRDEREGIRLPGFPLWADEWRPITDLRVPGGTPEWKRDYLVKNAEFYTAHRGVIDAWAAKWGIYTSAFPPSRRKLEWQAQDVARLWDCVINFRPSGIRAKAPTYLPALVAITQTSVIGPRERRLSPREAARLQGLPETFDFGEQPSAATYKQLGNGVSVSAIWRVLKAHVARDAAYLQRLAPELLSAIQSAPDSPDAVLAPERHNQL
ncbi:MAG: DNA cytosine methyltransferase [Dehalococcoidia bacterium]|nr:DNA cytosine methyltransferase [Dehalococcoidia bacterium]